MKKPYANLLLLIMSGLLVGILTGCGGSSAGTTAAENESGEPVKLILGAYTTPREAYQELIPIFQKQWKDQTGQDVIFEESYLGSGAQSRAILEGFEADVAALSLEADINRIENAGLITHDWKDNTYQGMVSDSIVSFAVRPGNPEGIKDWADLGKPGLEILTPNPKTSGGAMWNILALYGAAKRGFIDGVAADDDAAEDAADEAADDAAFDAACDTVCVTVWVTTAFAGHGVEKIPLIQMVTSPEVNC